MTQAEIEQATSTAGMTLSEALEWRRSRMSPERREKADAAMEWLAKIIFKETENDPA